MSPYMRLLSAMIFLVASMPTPIWAEATAVATPTFEQYSVPRQKGAKTVPPDLGSHPLAKKFRSALRDGAKKGPNFAGHYALVSWGCGTACLRFAFVDTASGKVYFPERIESVSAAMPAGEDDPRSLLRFRRDSRLLEIDGIVGEVAGRLYFLMEEGELHPLCLIAKGGHACRELPLDATSAAGR